jgi:hypothetical protein
MSISDLALKRSAGTVLLLPGLRLFALAAAGIK